MYPPIQQIVMYLVGLVFKVAILHPYNYLSGAKPFADKPPVAQPLYNFPTFHGARRFITVFTRDFNWSLS
jgi:hypothetical protein